MPLGLVSSCGDDTMNQANDVLQLYANKENVNKSLQRGYKNKNQHNVMFKSICQQLAERAKYLKKRHHVMTDLFKRNEELYGKRHYDPVKFWKQQCYNTSMFNQNMLINTIWLQALANHVR